MKISSTAIMKAILPHGWHNGQPYVQDIFDPKQTHALYGITKDTLDSYKKRLKELGANRFRQVKVRDGWMILCFNANKMQLS